MGVRPIVDWRVFFVQKLNDPLPLLAGRLNSLPPLNFGLIIL
jgi:hypothetical protein